MKRFRFPAFIAVLLLVIVSTFAFNDKPDYKAGFTTIYQYQGDYTDQEVKDPLNWVQVSGTSCPSSGTMPCAISYEDSRENFDILVAGFDDLGEALAACSNKFTP